MLTNIVEWDKEIVIFLYQFFYKLPFITEILWLLSSIEVYLFGMLLWCYFLVAFMRKDTHTLKLSWLYGVIIVASFWLGQLFTIFTPFRTRPFVFLDIIPIIPHVANTSFPSSHALFFGISIAILIQWFFPIYQKSILIFLGGLMCLSRVIWAIHYPSDIFIWTIVWLLLGYTVFQIVFRVTSRFSTTNHI
jgi:undecaprenyl-diphosphatase